MYPVMRWWFALQVPTSRDQSFFFFFFLFPNRWSSRHLTAPEHVSHFTKFCQLGSAQRNLDMTNPETASVLGWSREFQITELSTPWTPSQFTLTITWFLCTWLTLVMTIWVHNTGFFPRVLYMTESKQKTGIFPPCSYLATAAEIFLFPLIYMTTPIFW